jgi:acyl-CoA synthetase (AMP-forming)/AMP-acid ligase II
MSDPSVDKTVPSGQISRAPGTAEGAPDTAGVAPDTAGGAPDTAGGAPDTAGDAPGAAVAAALSEPAEPRPFDALSYLEFNAARTPDAPAVWDEDSEQSFAALRDRVCALIARLTQEGIGTGDVVAVALPNVALYIALEIAVPASGAVLFPLPLGIGHRELASVLERSGARLLVTDDSPAGKGIAAVAADLRDAPALLAAADLDGERTATPPARALDPDSDSDPDPDPDPDRIVQIALTSGTTGLPKLASLSARLKQLTFEGFTTRLRVEPGDRMFPMSPITQGVGEMCLYALRRGATLVMLGERRFDAEAALTIAGDSHSTILGGVPTMIGRLLHSPAFDPTALTDLRLTVSAGAPLPPAVAREWESRTHSPIGSFYGAMDIGQLAVPDPGDPAEKRWTTVGRPHETAEFCIVSPDGRAVPAGEAGEICMRGPLVQDRYWGEDSGPYDADGWAHFGDLGFLDRDGYVHITGRIKDTIIRGGNNINPLEVEALLREHPAIGDACVVGRPDPDLGERAVAFIVPTAAGHPQLGLDELAAFLGERQLTRYKWPEQVELIDALPLGPTGKVDRQGLRRSLDATDPEEPR